MKLYDGGRFPNPRRVRIFLAEKGMTIPLVPVDLGKSEHKGADFTAINPLQRVPVLELDDGTRITESVAICRYLEETQPNPPLFGQTPTSKALIEMWNRRIEMNLFTSIAAVFRHTHPGMAELEKPQVPAWAEANRPKIAEHLKDLNQQLSRHRFVAGETYSIADITALVAVDFMRIIKLSIPEDCEDLKRWHELVSARPSANA